MYKYRIQTQSRGIFVASFARRAHRMALNMGAQRLRVLVVDGHMSTSLDVAAFLWRQLNARVELILFYGPGRGTVQYGALQSYMQRVGSPLLSDEIRENITSYTSACHFGTNFRPCIQQVEPGRPVPFPRHVVTEIENSVDVVLCQFPGFQCALFEQMNVGLVIRFAHRFDHHIDKLPHGRKLWVNMLQRWNSTNRASFFADNPYDVEYLRYFTGVRATLWPMTGASVEDDAEMANRPADPQWCFCCWSHFPYAGAQHVLNAIRHAASGGSRKDNSVALIRDVQTRPNSSRLVDSGNCTAYLMIPYSLHGGSNVEAYSSGYPILVPSPTLLARWQFKHSIIPHRFAGNKGYSMWARDLGTDRTINSPDTNDENIFAKWLSFVDIYHWPGVRQYDSVDQIPAIMANVSHATQRNQHQFMRRVADHATRCVEEQLWWQAKNRWPSSTVHFERSSNWRNFSDQGHCASLQGMRYKEELYEFGASTTSRSTTSHKRVIADRSRPTYSPGHSRDEKMSHSGWRALG